MTGHYLFMRCFSATTKTNLIFCDARRVLCSTITVLAYYPCVCLYLAQVHSGTVLPLTPPSVVKPPGPSDAKSDTISNVKKALLFEPDGEMEDTPLLAPVVQSEEAAPATATVSGPPSVMPAVPTPDKSSNKRMQGRSQPDASNTKKAKP